MTLLRTEQTLLLKYERGADEDTAAYGQTDADTRCAVSVENTGVETRNRKNLLTPDIGVAAMGQRSQMATALP